MLHTTHDTTEVSFRRAAYRVVRLNVRGRDKLAQAIRRNLADLERIVKDLGLIESVLNR